MNELRDLARDGPIARFVEQSTLSVGRSEMTGVSLRVDDYWLSWFSHRHGFWPRIFGQRQVRVHFGVRYDFSLRPSDWDEYCKRKGMGPVHPVAVVVILRNEIRDGIPETWPRFIDDHSVLYEYRPEAVLQSVAPGDTVTGMTSGTLGGYFWRASDGRHFAVSCAHVLGSGASSAIYAGSLYVGNVVESHFPPVSVGKCNNRMQSSVSSHAVDVAVADLAGGIPIQLAHPGVGKIAAWTPIAHIGQGDKVELSGSKSGMLVGKVKECNIWKEISFQGSTYCFGDLLVVEDTTYQYIARQFTKPGDSGAWVVSTGAGHASWDAMLIAGDGANAYCGYAENIMAMIDPALSIPP